MIPCIIRIFELEQTSLTLTLCPITLPWACSRELFLVNEVAGLRYILYSPASLDLCFDAVSLSKLNERTILRTCHLVAERKSAYA